VAGRLVPLGADHERGVVLVFKFFGLGSIIEATPLLRAIRQRLPGVRLIFLTFEPNRDLLERLSLCDEVGVIRTRTPRPAGVLRSACAPHRREVAPA